MQRNLDIGTLRALVTVVDMAGVIRAANKLHLTQSTVSMQIKRLEETLGVTLLQRDGRTVKPTRKGEQLVKYAKKLVAINDETIDRLTNIDHNGELRFGVPMDLAAAYIPEILKRFVHDYPQVTLSLTIDNTNILHEKFLAGKLDLIFTTEFEIGPKGQNLLCTDLVWTGAVGGKAWLKDPIPLAFTPECVFNSPAVTALESVGIGWVDALQDINYSFDSSSIAVAADLAIRADIGGFIAPGTEQIIDEENRLPVLPRYQVNAYVTDGPDKDIADVFLRCAKSIFAKSNEQAFIDNIAV